MRIEARRKGLDEGRWFPVVRTPKGLALNVSIYDRKPGDFLRNDEMAEAKAQFERVGYEWRVAPE